MRWTGTLEAPAPGHYVFTLEPADSFPRALREIRRTITDSQGKTRSEIEEVEPLAADVRPTRHEGRGHLGRMGQRLGGAVEAYNAAVGSLERQVMSQARRFNELGVTADAPLAEIEQVTQLARTSSAPAAVESPNAHKA